MYIYNLLLIQVQVSQKPRKSLRSADNRAFDNRLGTASDSDSEEEEYRSRGQKNKKNMRQVSIYSPSNSGSDYPNIPPPIRSCMADTPSSGNSVWYKYSGFFYSEFLFY